MPGYDSGLLGIDMQIVPPDLIRMTREISQAREVAHAEKVEST
jgi:hypothetical protein